jgi:hypothetical protein
MTVLARTNSSLYDLVALTSDGRTPEKDLEENINDPQTNSVALSPQANYTD